MKFGRDFRLMFYAQEDLTEIMKDLLQAEDVKEFVTDKGKRIFVGTNLWTATGVAIVEKVQEKEYQVKLIGDGKEEDIVLFTGEKIKVPQKFVIKNNDKPRWL